METLLIVVATLLVVDLVVALLAISLIKKNAINLAIVSNNYIRKQDNVIKMLEKIRDELSTDSDEEFYQRSQTLE